MTALRYIDRLRRMDLLIRTRSTGSAHELATRMGLCERTIYEYLNDLKELGAPVSWSPCDNSYVYTMNGKFCFSFVAEHQSWDGAKDP